MSHDICDPVRLPREGSSNYEDWMRLSRALTSMLRHTGSGMKDGHLRITDDTGWAKMGDIFATAAKRNRPKLAPITLANNHCLGIVLDDDKGRFQLGVIVAAPVKGAPWSTDTTTKLRVHHIYAMRATNGHSVRIDQTKISTPLTAEHAPLVSALTHKTEARNIPSIIKFGLRPGGLPPPGVPIESRAPRGAGDRAT
eukprot:10485390-Heterocapsa_arctica.AAC.1